MSRCKTQTYGDLVKNGMSIEFDESYGAVRVFDHNHHLLDRFDESDIQEMIEVYYMKQQAKQEVDHDMLKDEVY